MHAGDDREVPPIFRDFASLQIGDLSESGFGRGSKSLDGIWIVRLPHSINIESISWALGISQDGIVLAVECTANGRGTMIDPDDFIQNNSRFV